MTQESIKSQIRLSVVVDKEHIKSLEKMDAIIDNLFEKHKAELEEVKVQLSAEKDKNEELKAKLTRKPKEKPIKDAVKCDYKVARKVGGCDSLCLESGKFFWNEKRKLCQIKDEYRHLLKEK